MLYRSNESVVADHCRIGSLEIISYLCDAGIYDHCRIGSLEIVTLTDENIGLGSLPHRQLRKQQGRLNND